jgi:hypothetical protein
MTTQTVSKHIASLVLAMGLAASVLTSGCTVHARVYDPYYHDYHVWVNEEPYYNQWEHDTHRDHVEFAKRNQSDQKAYWDWRHSQGH